MNSSRPFDGRVTLITGANGGIGKEFVREFSARGSNVVIHHFDTAELEETEDIARMNGVDSLSVQADIRDPDQVEAMMEKIRRRYGRLDHCIANAAFQTAKPFLKNTREDIQRTCRTNLEGTMYCAQEALRLMLENRTAQQTLVFLGSINSRMPQPVLAAYASTKGAIESLMTTLAIEFGPEGIVVTGISPGPVPVPRTREITPDYEKQWASVTPIRQLAQARQIANQAADLCTDKGIPHHGQMLKMDGGLSVKRITPNVKPG